MKIPEINKRIKKVIDYYANSIVKKFAENINLPQQTLNRLFIIDKRTGKYPIATTEILQRISEMYDINPEWLLIGKGEMLKNQNISHAHTPVSNISTAKDTNNNSNTQENSYVIEKIEKDIAETDANANTVYLYDVSAAAGCASFDIAIRKENIIGKYIIPDFQSADFMIYVKGSSMYPKYSSGDIIACKIIYESQFIQWGKVYVLATAEQGLLVKRIIQSEKENYIKAVSDNKDYPPFDIPKNEICGLALVLGVLRLE